MAAPAKSILSGEFPNPALDASRGATTRAQAAAREKALQEKAITETILKQVNRLFIEHQNDPNWWTSGSKDAWLQDLCHGVAGNLVKSKLKHGDVCMWIEKDDELRAYITRVYNVAHATLNAVNADDNHLAEPDDLVEEIRTQLDKKKLLDDESEFVVEPLVRAQRKVLLKSKSRSSSRVRQPRASKNNARRVHQLGPLKNALVNLLVTQGRHFSTAEQLLQTLEAQNIAEEAEDKEFVENALDAFDIINMHFQEVLEIQNDAESIELALRTFIEEVNSDTDLADLIRKDARMQTMIKSFAEQLIHKYENRNTKRKWALVAAAGGTVALFSLLGSLQWFRKRRRQ